MSLLYDVIFATRCTSTHHRLAVDALRHLDFPDAEKWQNLFLHFYDAYLKGAKAPDDTFKDFKNHVCHVKDNYWGGAPDEAERWYAATVKALAAKDWNNAVYSAGVMTHYIADPLQPFHTGQTEAENVIHRAVEQSFSKSYSVFQEMLEASGGYGQVSLPSGAGWIAKTVRMGAEASNPHYDIIIDHYDFKRGAKKPLEGLDDALRAAIAPLIGRAAITIARVLERAIAEAAVKPAFYAATLDGFFAQMGAPIAQIAGKIADGKEAALVQSMYKEFVKTGKVAKTLPDDDKEVRALYAAEVLKTPVAKLDAEKPRAIGAAHGQDIAGKPAPKPSPKPAAAKAPPAEKPAKAEKPVKEKTAAAPRKRKKKAEPEAVYDPNSPFAVLAQGGALDAATHHDDALLDPPPAPPPAPGVRLHRDDLIIDAPAIGPKAAARFEAIGYKTVADLLDASPDDAAKSLRASHMTPPIIRDWQAQALLACTLPNVRSVDAQALVACDIRDIETLARQDAKKLAASIDSYLKTPAGKNIARSSKPATLDAVKAWIEAAKKAPKEAAAAEKARARKAS